MKLFLLRHGEAEPYCPADSTRQLTARGVAETNDVLEKRSHELNSVTSFWASPYVRAQQTATLAQKFIPHLMFDTTELLVPEANPERLSKAIELSGVESLLMVTHQPLIGTFVDWLAGLEAGKLRLGTSSLVCIETEYLMAGAGELLWVNQPW
ncbi:phosphohistidine phosphatase SixA [Sessilibacter sp. MAH2]